VLFDTDYAIFRCVALPVDGRARGTYRKYVNERLVQATDALLNHESAEDLTEDLLPFIGSRARQRLGAPRRKLQAVSTLSARA